MIYDVIESGICKLGNLFVLKMFVMYAELPLFKVQTALVVPATKKAELLHQKLLISTILQEVGYVVGLFCVVISGCKLCLYSGTGLFLMKSLSSFSARVANLFGAKDRLKTEKFLRTSFKNFGLHHNHNTLS